jgi:hypothetical protein
MPRDLLKAAASCLAGCCSIVWSTTQIFEEPNSDSPAGLAAFVGKVGIAGRTVPPQFDDLAAYAMVISSSQL